MTIKPIVSNQSQQKRVGAAGVAADGDKKDTVVGADSSGNVVVSAGLGHRNVVLDGQSPQRVFEELATRHRRSPHKSTRSKRRDHHDLHHKREKHSASVATAASGVGKCNSPNMHGASAQAALNVAAVVGNGGSPSHAVNFGNIALSSAVGAGGKSPAHDLAGMQSPNAQNSVGQSASGLLKAIEEAYSGYNSGDEHLQPKDGATTADEWNARDEQFAKCMESRGYVLKPVEEDGACLFRAISLQIYGDEDMHDVIRQNTMDYIYKNREYFCHFVTEDINSYIKRKRRKDSHGNHIEIQAMSEIYSRPVEVYCYKPTPINIFNSEQANNAPLRLSYQRGSHYNAIIDPYNATVGVGLGLAGYKPELQTKEAARLSEQLEIEQTMFEDKLKTTDWEATNEAIEEQIARESYLQWCRENLRKSRAVATSTATSAEAMPNLDAEASPSKYSTQRCSTVTSAAPSSPKGNQLTEGNLQPPAAANAGVASLTSSNLIDQYGMSKSQSANSSCSADLGFDSDDTDMSSTSSLGAGNASPNSSGARLSKKLKNRSSAGTVGGLRGSKKRRREQLKNANISDACKDATVRKSPKRDSPLLHECNTTSDMEQQPSTSKQSLSPEKTAHKQSNTAQAETLPPSSPNASNFAVAQPQQSSFYQELLEASYAVDGQNEAELLAQAIRMSTQDYMEDQKRKYLYGP